MNRKAFPTKCVGGLLVVLIILVFWIGLTSAQAIEQHNPLRYNLLGSTSHASGTLSDVHSDDLDYLSFSSYFSGTDLLQQIGNNASDVDFSGDKGTHSNFSAQRIGPDAVCDTIAEEDTSGGGLANYELDLEIQWTDISFHEEDEVLAIHVDLGNNTNSFDATGGYMIIGDGTADWGSTAGTISMWIQWDFVGYRPWGQHNYMETRFLGSNLVLDWGGTTSLTSNTNFVVGKWYMIAITWNENTNDLSLYVGDLDNPPTLDAQNNAWNSTVSTVGVTENNFMASRGGLDPTDGRGDDLRYWDIDRNLTEIQGDYSCELDGSETNLRSYFRLNDTFDDEGPDNNTGIVVGSYSFSSSVPFDPRVSESIQLDVWSGSSWQTLFTDLKGGWNNISVSLFLDSSTFTVRFKGGNELNDTTQDFWGIDVALLHVWSNEYTAEVEFLGDGNQDDWSQLAWTVVASWTKSLVTATIQLYNYTLGDYSSSGDGFVSYVSSAIPREEKIVSEIITMNPTHFRNETGHWKIKVAGVKVTVSPFELMVDLVKFESRGTQGVLWPIEWTIGLICIVAVGVLFPLAVKFEIIRKRDKTTSSRLTFDEQFGTTYNQLVGRKTLLEVDPTFDYHSALFALVSEATNRGERIVIFTSKGSALHTEFSGRRAELFLLTPNISSSKQINRKEILLPVSDLSVSLDALVKTTRKRRAKPVTILFDNLSDTILMCGFEKTYRFLRFLLEALSPPTTTALFIFNPTAHDTATSSSIRGLFNFRLADLRTEQKPHER